MQRQLSRLRKSPAPALLLAMLALISACDIKVNDSDNSSAQVSTANIKSKVIQCVEGVNGQCPFLLYSQDCSQAASQGEGGPSRILCSFVEVQSFYIPAGQSRELKGDAADLMTCQGAEGVIPSLDKCLNAQIKSNGA